MGNDQNKSSAAFDKLASRDKTALEDIEAASDRNLLGQFGLGDDSAILALYLYAQKDLDDKNPDFSNEMLERLKRYPKLIKRVDDENDGIVKKRLGPLATEDKVINVPSFMLLVQIVSSGNADIVDYIEKYDNGRLRGGKIDEEFKKMEGEEFSDKLANFRKMLSPEKSKE